MKLVKSLLLGSAAGLSAVAGAQAADLPVKKAAPVEYVRVCSAYGAGFFYIPGTDTCLRVSGRARFEYQYSESFNRNNANGDVSGYRSLGRMNLDARTQTAYGTLRAFVRFDIASRTGAYLKSGTQERFANAFPALGADTFARVQKFVDVDKAFIQFAGFTAGKAASFFDFYAHDFEIIGSSIGSDVSSTNLLAYTATFGEGFSATISMEDPSFRRTPLFSPGNIGNPTLANGQQVSSASTGFTPFSQTTVTSPVVVATDANGNPIVATAYDVTQKNRLPDFVGVLRYDAPWGSAQISAAVHEINVGNANGVFFTSNTAGGVFQVAGGVLPAANSFSVPRAQNEYGFAIQGGLKVNTPFIAAGDSLYLQGAYGSGANNYVGITNVAGEIQSAAIHNGGNFNFNMEDGVLNPFTRRIELTQAFSVTASYLHYWTPEWRSAFFGTYGEVYFPRNSRTALSLLGANTGGVATLNLPVSTAAQVNAFNFNQQLRDNSVLWAGASLIWSPVRDLDIGVEGVYTRAAILQGRVTDNNRSPVVAINGVPIRSVTSDDNVFVRFRVQRDF